MTKDGKPVLGTDEYGTYQRITLNPESAAATKVTAELDTSVTQAGLTDADVLDAQKFLSRFIVEEASDSTALDTDDGAYAKWVKANEDKYIAPEFQDFIRTDGDTRALLNTRVNAKISFHYLRSGKPREADVRISYEKVNNVDQNGDHNLIFTGTLTNDYLAKSEDVVAGYKAAGYTEEAIYATLPSLRDGSGTATITGDMKFEYAVAKEANGWRITGYTNSFNNEVKG